MCVRVRACCPALLLRVPSSGWVGGNRRRKITESREGNVPKAGMTTAEEEGATGDGLKSSQLIFFTPDFMKL